MIREKTAATGAPGIEGFCTDHTCWRHSMSRDQSNVHTEDAAVLPPPDTAPGAQQLSLFSREALGTLQQEETRWRRDVLDPVLAKKPYWKKDYTTVGGMEVNPHGHAAVDRRSGLPRGRVIRASFRTRAASIRPAIAAGSGRCASSPASAPRGNERALQIPAVAGTDRTVDRLPPADALRLRLRSRARAPAKSASAASPSTRWRTWRRSSTASTSRTSPSR